MPFESADHQNSPIDRSAKGVSLTILAISAALLAFIVYAGLSMDRASQRMQIELVENALNQSVVRVLMEQKGWAIWDEAVKRLDRPDVPAEWLDANISAPLAEGYKHDRLYVLSPDDRVIYGYGGGKQIDPATLAHLLPALYPMLREIRAGVPRPYIHRDGLFKRSQHEYNRLRAAQSLRWAANILKDGNEPVIVSIMSVVPSLDQTLIRKRPYLLVSIVRLDQASLAEIGRLIHLDDFRLDRGGRDPGLTLLADDGTPIGRLVWTASGPGEAMMTHILPLVIVLIIMAMLYARMIFRRLGQAHRQLGEQEAAARFLALHDGLSQLPNRRHFTNALRDRLQSLAEPGGASRLCIAYLDVDRFKDVNDAIGHGAGDALIMQIGPRLRDLLRADDMLARLGGDEFAVLRELRSDVDDPKLLGETIMTAFKRPFEIGGTQLEVTASAGLAVVAAGERDPVRVLQNADISLYKAKDLGRNRYAFFETAMSEQVRIRHGMEKDLRAAIGTGQIFMHYQPVVSTRTRRTTSFEALVRWDHPTRGLIPPIDFIPLAEQCGLMVPLGDHILETVFREAGRFPGIDLAINLSPIQLRQRQLPDRLEQLSRLFRVDPRRIVLEVTESMLIEANDASTGVFGEIRELGFRTALDDFGTGYSSLGYLHRFDFDKIKIDRSFVSTAMMERMRPIIEGIVHIGRGLRMDIVAEGVETAAEFCMVRAMGCSEAQGYFISRPLPLADAVRFFEEEGDARENVNVLSVAQG